MILCPALTPMATPPGKTISQASPKQSTSNWPATGSQYTPMSDPVNFASTPDGASTEMVELPEPWPETRTTPPFSRRLVPDSPSISSSSI